MKLEQYSFGIGDRFGREGAAQLRALQQAHDLGISIVPVWNKSNREHVIVGSSPEDTRAEADEAVRVRGWKNSYYVDADHIGLKTVDRFLASSDFYTMDVADFIGKPAAKEKVEGFLKAMERFVGTLAIPGVRVPLVVTRASVAAVANKYLAAIEEAGRVYRHIADKKGSDGFVPEVSVDEANYPQTPFELLFILAAVAHEGIPIQTIAPKFTGAFLKGVDYVGDVDIFAREFEEDIAVVAFAVKTFRLPANLKLSVHSGSDKFSLYPVMHRILNATGAGLHLKTAGTTWLEEMIGLAASGGKGLTLAKEIYTEAHARFDELCKPYESVIDIDRARLPGPAAVASWNEREFVQALQHDQENPNFSTHFRQLVHVGYKVAAEMGDRYRELLTECRVSIEANVTLNLFDRHIQPLFLGKVGKGLARTPATANSPAVA